MKEEEEPQQLEDIEGEEENPESDEMMAEIEDTEESGKHNKSSLFETDQGKTQTHKLCFVFIYVTL